jgi:UDP-N-acetylmuramoyl-L-alanyl-D-glutamate--2,6-diaminopimelate ligase
MRFLELMRVVGGRGVVVEEMRAGSGEGPEILGVCEDSRKVRAGDLFVARSGTKRSGGEFVAEAVSRGAVAVVSAENVAVPEGLALARVGNGNLAAALLAHEVAGNPTREMKMIGVTGTKGKTTVAYLMRSVLKAAGAVVGMVGTVEIDDGKTVVPAEMTTPGAVELVELFSRMKKNGVTHCVMEVSSHALHQDRVAGIEWAVGMFTNLTGDHLDYHGTMEEYGAAKARLFEGLGAQASAIINADDAFASRIIRDCRAKIVPIHIEPLPDAGVKKLISPVPPDHGWAALIQGMTSKGMRLHVRGPSSVVFEFNTPLVGRYNAYNLLLTIAGACSLGMNVNDTGGGIKGNKGAPGRLQPVVPLEGSRDEMPFQVFVDYAHTHDSLENVLIAVRATMGRTEKPPKGGTPNRLICVFGCGGDRDRTKRPKMGAVAERLADVVVVTSDNPRTENPDAIIQEVCAGFSDGWKEKGKIAVETDRRSAIRRAIGEAKAGDVVLIAGKGHENYQIVGTTKSHFDDVEEAAAAMSALGH